MKTRIPKNITNQDEAEAYLDELIKNNEDYHPEDNAREVMWDMPKIDWPTGDEVARLNIAMNQIYQIEGFDPCEYIWGQREGTVFANVDPRSPEKLKPIAGVEFEGLDKIVDTVPRETISDKNVVDLIDSLDEKLTIKNKKGRVFSITARHTKGFTIMEDVRGSDLSDACSIFELKHDCEVVIDKAEAV